MPTLPAALKGCNFLMTIEISSSEIDMGEGTSAGYEALGMLVRSAFDMVGKNCDFRASVFPERVIAMLAGVTMLGMVEGVGGDGFVPLPILPVPRFPFFLLHHQPQPA